MKKLILSVCLATSCFSYAAQKQINVHCQQPSGLAGGISATLDGVLQLYVSPTTGMTKAKGTLDLTIKGQTQKIAVEGGSFISDKLTINPVDLNSEYSEFSLDFRDIDGDSRSKILNIDRLKDILLSCSLK